MSFLWPENLWWLLALALLPLLQRALQRRRGATARRWPALRVTGGAAPAPRWQAQLPGALLFAALALLVLALARPTASLPLPWARSTIWLAMDVSRSMRVADVKPTRMVAAQEAAKAFVAEVPKHIDVGLVTFAGTAQVVQRATLDRPSLVSAIDAIQMQYGTAIGSAIVVCLSELFPDHGIDVGDMTFGPQQRTRALDEKPKPPPKEIDPVPPGSHDAAAIILLSDGRRTTGIDTLKAARMAADRGVRIYVIGLGTVDGAAASGEDYSIYMQLDEPTLREVAKMTGGEYHHAGTAEDLRTVYQHLGSRLQIRTRETELTAAFALVAALLLAAGAGVSVAWFGRV